ncbi:MULTISPECIES: hypothetical protein [Desulfitobacterium]|uniref:Uncharacterized protein n=1 Tax=Desulfitobacterium dehalogenans (strain ATCC 51507 / DSM 9161 / JW/IU-DC1) TaxID=756499 RepID=I4AAB7_DESDJ|nr:MULTISPECIES: hypothetical protein [Desulfitobacterium]AFM00902.1 hypothetical protein Desde_2572 [Desulfitobacterium dehalogenans ATCC 51507]
MGRLNLHYNDGGSAPDGVGLLISILIRYPEVCSVRYQQPDHALTFRFTVAGSNQGEKFRDTLREALRAYHRIEGYPMRICEIELKLESGVALVTVTRDVESMNEREIGLIVDLVRDITQSIIYDETEIPEEEQAFQEEVIGQILQSFRDCRLEKGFIAVREEGRVLVYNS